MEVRHNTAQLEEALAHVVRRASIPTLRAEAEARQTSARAIGFRRLATGAAIALASAGIGIGLFLANHPKPQQLALPSIDVPKKPQTIMPDTPIVQPAYPPPSSSTYGHVTTNYNKFNFTQVKLLGTTWDLTVGHLYRDNNQLTWDKAWCYTSPTVADVKVWVDLATRDSPYAKPNAPVASEETLAKVGLTDEAALALASLCPWADEKQFNVADFIAPPGHHNPFRSSSPPLVTLVGMILNYDGVIDEHFMEVLKKYSFDTLNMNSPGGSVTQAMEGGQWLHENNKIVKIGDNCLSACVYVLAGGIARIAKNTSKIGVHRFVFLNETDPYVAVDNTHKLLKDTDEFLQYMAISHELWKQTEEVPAADIRYLEHSDLLDWQLLTLDFGGTHPDPVLSSNLQWVGLFSNQDVSKAIAFARRYAAQGARVVRAQNNWFQVLVGPTPATNIPSFRKTYKGPPDLPGGEYFPKTDGHQYVETVWQASPQP